MSMHQQNILFSQINQASAWIMPVGKLSKKYYKITYKENRFGDEITKEEKRVFCTKCGKEIDDSAKFCKYCGSPVEVDTEEALETPSDTDTAEESEVFEEPVPKIKNRKKWVVPVCIAAGIAVLGGMGVLAANMAKAEKEEPKKVEQTKPEKETAKEEPKTEKEPEVTYPKDITLDAEVQNKITEFLDLLCKMDASGSGHNFAINNDFASRFLLDSMWFEIPFADGQPVEGWSVSEEIAKKYLKTSIGVEEFTADWASVSDGMVVSQGVQVTCAYGNDTPQIIKITQLSETDIQVLGSVNYTPEFQGEPYTADFDVTLTANSDSIWGGYTLKSINKWDETLEIQMKKFVEILGYCENASSWMADGKSLTEFNSAELSKAFLWWTAKFDQINNNNEMKNKYDCTITEDGYCLITEENAEKFLMSSIGQSDNSTMDYRDDKIMSMLGNVGSSGVENVTITEITNISDTDIKVDGSVVFHAEGRITRNVSFSITMTANPDSMWGGYTLKSIDKWEETNVTVQNTDEQPESALGEYLVFLVNAVNSGDYTGADEVMLKGSSLYQEQEALVKKLHSENTTEKLKTWSVLEKEQLDGTHARITSDEVIEVTYAGGNSKTLYQSYVYTCELTESGWLFTSISAVE